MPHERPPIEEWATLCKHKNEWMNEWINKSISPFKIAQKSFWNMKTFDRSSILVQLIVIHWLCP